MTRNATYCPKDEQTQHNPSTHILGEIRVIGDLGGHVAEGSSEPCGLVSPVERVEQQLLDVLAVLVGDGGDEFASLVS